MQAGPVCLVCFFPSHIYFSLTHILCENRDTTHSHITHTYTHAPNTESTCKLFEVKLARINVIYSPDKRNKIIPVECFSTRVLLFCFLLGYNYRIYKQYDNECLPLFYISRLLLTSNTVGSGTIHGCVENIIIDF